MIIKQIKEDCCECDSFWIKIYIMYNQSKSIKNRVANKKKNRTNCSLLLGSSHIS